jgi:cysteine desulfurase
MIYLDHSATTYVRPEVKEAMIKHFDEEFGNPGSFHSKGLEAKEAVDSSRQVVADILGVSPSEIIFTGSGTISINLALKGVARAKGKGHIVTSSVEHPAVLNTVKHLEKEGFSITILDTDEHGQVSPDKLKEAIRDDTMLVSIMYANNEIGTVNRIQELAGLCKEKGIIFHTDACQAGAYLNLKDLGVDLMTLNGSKIYGPKGMGCLYVKKGTPIEPLIHGGGQENGLVSGTHNVPGIVGFATALKLAQDERVKEGERLEVLRKRLADGLLEISRTLLNGHPTERLPNNVNISFLDVEGESVLLHLNEHGICASTGSACSSNSLDPSHVLLAIGRKHEVAHGAIRFSLGKRTREEDVDKVLEVMPGIIQKLRMLSPVEVKQ